MSKMSKTVREMRTEERENKTLHLNESVTNFMGGTSYKLDPINTLKMIAASSIFGEASYYRKGTVKDGQFRKVKDIFSDDFYKSMWGKYDRMTTTEIFERAIDDALDFDFKKTLELATELRKKYNMRLNPQVIMVRASIHPNRKKFTDENPGMFNFYNNKVMMRADEPMTQLAYYIWINNGYKNGIPSILKRSIANYLSNLDAYAINKYKNHEIGMINAVRIVHANSDLLDELMQNGNVRMLGDITTWEQKRSSGMSWKEIFETTNMGHMALLRNIRNVFTEVSDIEFCRRYMEKLVDGVKTGKQFPYRYYNAYETVSHSESVNHKSIILDYLEECIEEATVYNMPKLKGTTVCLSDNSGSAWNNFKDNENCNRVIAIIDNLSSVIAARCSDEGYVCKFGDTYKISPVSHKNGILKQAEDISKNKYSDVGAGTEGGIWEFFDDAIKNKKFYDNIFIFSDQQAGTGGLYGTTEQFHKYAVEYGGCSVMSYINIFKLILEYRKQVNPKVNVFSVQTAGYDNVVLPAMSYRCAMLTGWTGKEIQFAKEYIDQWDEIENKN